jgi:hypothetical protein
MRIKTLLYPWPTTVPFFNGVRPSYTLQIASTNSAARNAKNRVGRRFQFRFRMGSYYHFFVSFVTHSFHD